MRGEPRVVPLVGAQIVQDDVNLPLGRLIGDHLIHEGLEVGSFPGLRGLATDDASGNLQRSKEVDRPVTLIRAFDPLDDLAAAGLNVPSCALQCLNGRLSTLAQHAPHRTVRDSQRHRQRASIPAGHPGRWRQLKLRQQPNMQRSTWPTCRSWVRRAVPAGRALQSASAIDPSCWIERRPHAPPRGCVYLAGKPARCALARQGAPRRCETDAQVRPPRRPCMKAPPPLVPLHLPGR